MAPLTVAGILKELEDVVGDQLQVRLSRDAALQGSCGLQSRSLPRGKAASFQRRWRMAALAGGAGGSCP